MGSLKTMTLQISLSDVCFLTTALLGRQASTFMIPVEEPRKTALLVLQLLQVRPNLKKICWQTYIMIQKRPNLGHFYFCTICEFTRCALMCALCMNACSKSFTPLVNSHIDNVLVKISPDLMMFQFINPLHVCIVDTFLNGRPYLMVQLGMGRL